MSEVEDQQHNRAYSHESGAVIEVLYNYESTSARGHSVNVRPGERYSLVSDANENWWFVTKGIIHKLYVTPVVNSLTNGRQEQPLSDYTSESCYENLEVNRTRGRPPVPLPDETPIRLIHGEWEEFVDGCGRSYFYHRATGSSTWKPPRHMVAPKLGSYKLSSGEDLDSSFSTDDLERSQEEMLGSYYQQTSTDVDRDFRGRVESFDCPPKEKAAVLDVPSASSPVPLCTKEESESSNISQPSSSLTTSSDSTGSGREDLASVAKSRSMTTSVTVHRENDEEMEEGTEGGKILSRTATYPPFHQAVRSGLISRCRYAEAGKRIKKHWVSMFAYLTSAHMIFYRDEKSSQKKGNHYGAPLGVCDLRGAKISWMDGVVTRRKHVFQLELIDGTVDIFSADSDKEINGWFHSIRQSISRLPQPELYPSPFQGKHNESPASGRPSKTASTAVGNQAKEIHVEQPSPALGKHGKKDKRKSPGTTSGGQGGQGNAVDAGEQQSRASILEKLRRFFRTRPSIDSLKEKGIYKPEPVFGSFLAEICKREKLSVPKFLIVCTEMIEQKGLSVDGLYRISGNLSQVQKIRCQVDQDRYNLLMGEEDVHVLTGALKLFFRELQDPLFPSHMTKDFIAAIKLQNLKQRRSVFRDLLGKMPLPHHDTLKHLLWHLLMVSERSAENRMQVHNLAIVFGPTLFGTGSEGNVRESGGKTSAKKRGGNQYQQQAGFQSNSHLAFNMIMQGQIVEYLLKEYNRLFR